MKSLEWNRSEQFQKRLSRIEATEFSFDSLSITPPLISDKIDTDRHPGITQPSHGTPDFKLMFVGH